MLARTGHGTGPLNLISEAKEELLFRTAPLQTSITHELKKERRVVQLKCPVIQVTEIDHSGATLRWEPLEGLDSDAQITYYVATQRVSWAGALGWCLGLLCACRCMVRA